MRADEPMADIPLTDQISRQERKILGAQDWVMRARQNQIKRSPDAIEKASADLATDKAILKTLQWLDRNKDAVKAAAKTEGP